MSDDISSPKRPLLVTIIGILDLLCAIACIIFGIFSIASGTLVVVDDIENFKEITQFGGIVILIIGLIELLVGIGLLKGWRIMWYLGVIIYALGVIAFAAGLIMGFTIGDLIALIICVLILYYLFRPNVKAFFKI